MSSRYTEDTADGIYALMRQGFGPKEIIHRLSLDKAGLGHKVEMPYRTCQDYMKRLRKERGIPVPTIEPGEEYDAVAGMRREMLETVRQEQVLLKQKSAEKGLSAADLGRAEKLLKILDRYDAPEKPQQDTPDPGAEKRSQDKTFLSALAKKI